MPLRGRHRPKNEHLLGKQVTPSSTSDAERVKEILLNFCGIFNRSDVAYERVGSGSYARAGLSPTCSEQLFQHKPAAKIRETQYQKAPKIQVDRAAAAPAGDMPSNQQNAKQY